MGLIDATDAALAVAMRGVETRQQVIANNIANVNTPGFRRSDVSFESQLSSALNTDSVDAVESVSPITATDGSGAMRVDGNNVDIDRESTYLAQTQLQYAALSQMLSKRVHTLASVISGAR